MKLSEEQIEHERPRFEDAYKRTFPKTAPGPLAYALCWMGDRYYDSHMQSRWEGWLMGVIAKEENDA